MKELLRYHNVVSNFIWMVQVSQPPQFSAVNLGFILFVDLVSYDILQMALETDLLKKFGGSLGEEYYITLTNAICCTFKQLAAVP